VLPLAVLLLWVRPLMEQPLELGPDTVLHLRVGALLFAGALQALLLRPLVQSYLDSGLIVWCAHSPSCAPSYPVYAETPPARGATTGAPHRLWVQLTASIRHLQVRAADRVRAHQRHHGGARAAAARRGAAPRAQLHAAVQGDPLFKFRIAPN
jgi:hypothetical protein